MRAAALSQVKPKLNIQSNTSVKQARGPGSSPSNSPEKRLREAETTMGLLGQAGVAASTSQTTSAPKPDK